MLEKFRIAFGDLQGGKENVPRNATYLLALSGGLDSCVMAHLFHRAGIACSVAHCNFQLRAKASDDDEQFVRQLAVHNGFDFYVKKFQTTDFASDNGISIQMAARNLRYQWFNELVKQHNFASVAVAHHANDVAETMLLNLAKGTGLAGMHGIGSINGKVIRPLLFAARSELEDYAKKHGLTWREDESNSEDAYSRNKIRLNVIPHLIEINPLFIDAMSKHARLMNGYEKLLNKFIDNEALSLTGNISGGMVHSINLNKLLNFPEPEILLFHLINKYGFNGEICKEVLASRRTGAEFFASGYKLVIGRDELFILNTSDLNREEEFIMHENELLTDLSFGSIEMQVIHGRSDITGTDTDNFTDHNAAFLDGDKLSFPLKIRRWQKGDIFHPLGMKGKKLLSDFFVDEKFTPAQKELVYLLLSGQDIVWVIGHRIDDRYKLTESTTCTRKFTWKPK